MSGLSRQGSGLLDFFVSDELLDFSVKALTMDSHLIGGHFLADLAGVDTPPPVPTRTKNLTENLLMDHQVCKHVEMMPAGSAV